MAVYRIKAVKDGNTVEETREAGDRYTLSHTLAKDGYTVISIEDEATRAKEPFDVLGFLKRVNTHDKIIFARNLGSMVEAGLSVTRAISVMDRQTKNPKLKKILQDLHAQISQGKTLSESLAAHPDTFSSLFVSMVKAGEESGNMAGSLKTVANQMEKTYALIKKVRGAMLYPAVIFSIMIIIGILMLIYVVPTLTSTFKDLNVKLPASTRFIIAISDFLRTKFLIAISAFIVAVTGFTYAVRSKVGQRSVDKAVLKFPIIGPMTREINSARTARTLSSLLSSGVDVVVALGVTRDVLQNSYYKEVLTKAEENIQSGKSISSVFSEREDLYPVFVGEMISVGEETGKIGEMLIGVADFYEDEVDQKTKNLSTIIEPLLMVVIGAAVGFFAISMLMPTYSLVDAI